jgi:hypothetical protein
MDTGTRVEEGGDVGSTHREECSCIDMAWEGVQFPLVRAVVAVDGEKRGTISDGMAGASAEDDMGRAEWGAVLLICRDARRISRYAEELIEERGASWFGLGRMTADFWFSSSESSRSHLFELEAGLAEGTSRLSDH